MDDKKIASKEPFLNLNKEECTEKTLLRSIKNRDSGHPQSSNNSLYSNSKIVKQTRLVVRAEQEEQVINSDSLKVLAAELESHEQVKNHITTGSVLKNRFELLEVIGHGGMGVVYKAIDRRDIEAQHCLFLAIKVLNDEFEDDADLLKALHGEARKTQQLAHPNIVNVFDFDRDGSIVFMTMEYINGISLETLIKSKAAGVGTKETVKIVNQMASALIYAHSRHIIHSDFKPSNVFINDDNQVKVLDFGIARVVKNEQHSVSFDAGVLGGLTPAYASLEMLCDEEPAPADDIYALACVTYELLTGKHPFNGQRADVAMKASLAPEKVDGLNVRQWKALNKGLAFKKKNRFAEVEVFIEGLNANKSKLPAFLTVICLILVMVGFFVKQPLLTYFSQQQFEKEINELVTGIGQGDFTETLKVLHLLESLTETDLFRIETEERILNKILKRIELNDHHFVSQLIINFGKLNEKFRKKILFQGKAGILAFYEKEMDTILFSSRDNIIYSNIESLLKHATELYPDSVKLRHLQDNKKDLINKLEERFSSVLKQKKMLLSPNADNIVDVLNILIRINPDNPLISDPRVETLYAQEAEKALNNNLEEIAKQLIEQGSMFFPGSAVLAKVLDQIRQLEQVKDKQGGISKLEKKIENLVTVYSADIYIWLKQVREVFKQLTTLQADNQFVVIARHHTEELLKEELELLTGRRAWERAFAIVSDSRTILSEQAFIDSNNKIIQLKKVFNGLIEMLFNKINILVKDNPTDKTIEQINVIFEKIEKLGAKSTLIQIKRRKAASTFVQQADKLSRNGALDKAIKYLEFATKINTEKTFQQHIDNLKTEIVKTKKPFKIIEKGHLISEGNKVELNHLANADKQQSVE